MNIAALEHRTGPVNLVVDGHSLAHQRLTYAARVRLAVQLSTGQATLVRPTQTQCSRLMGVGESAVSMAAHRSRQPAAAAPMTDAAAEKMIVKIGLSRVLDLLDKLTSPKVTP